MPADAYAKGAFAQVRIKVVDQEGYVVSGARIWGGFTCGSRMKDFILVDGVSNANGEYIAQGRCNEFLRFDVRKDGYYHTEEKIFFGRSKASPIIVDGRLKKADIDCLLNNHCKSGKRSPGTTSLSTNNNGFPDYFLLNDIRNGDTTIHSWDVMETTDREKRICLLLLKNRRKGDYGPLDGNPLSLSHFQSLDASIRQSDIDALCKKGILQMLLAVERKKVRMTELQKADGMKGKSYSAKGKARLR